MNPAERKPTRRIVIACSGATLPAVLAALLRHLAVGPGDELRGLFIEDSDMLKAAGLPFTFEFSSITRSARPIDRERVENALRHAAAAVQRDLARLAAEAGLSWHFEVVRERRRVALDALLKMTDAVFLAPSADSTDVLSSTSPAPVLALIDDGAAGSRALALARAVAEAEHAPLAIYRASSATANAAGTTAGSPLARLAQRPVARLAIVAAPLLASAEHPLTELCEASLAPLVIVR
ncbi:MAG: hypothetical protein WD928_00555 [Gammaproteobacteria bacterium]